jgi:hypothetical protein
MPKSPRPIPFTKIAKLTKKEAATLPPVGPVPPETVQKSVDATAPSREPMSAQDREKHAQIVLNLLFEATAGKAATQEAICNAAKGHLQALIHG